MNTIMNLPGSQNTRNVSNCLRAIKFYYMESVMLKASNTVSSKHRRNTVLSVRGSDTTGHSPVCVH